MKRGRSPVGIEKMLRMHLLRICSTCLSRPTGDAIYESYVMRKFTGAGFMAEAVPDEITLCKFSHFFGGLRPEQAAFDAINCVMVQTGHMIKGDTIVDSIIISAFSSI